LFITSWAEEADALEGRKREGRKRKERGVLGTENVPTGGGVKAAEKGSDPNILRRRMMKKKEGKSDKEGERFENDRVFEGRFIGHT